MPSVIVCFSKYDDVYFGGDPFLMGAMMLQNHKFTDIVFVEPDSVTCFVTRPGQVFRKVTANKQTNGQAAQWNTNSITHVCLEIKMSDEERHKLLRTCETFAGIRIPYNLKDRLFFCTPLWTPDEAELFRLAKLADVQAAILFLRECLSPDHLVVIALRDLNSRCCGSETLFDALKPVATRIPADPLLNTLIRQPSPD